MKRNTTWAMTTLSAVALLLSYRTSLAGPQATAQSTAQSTTNSGPVTAGGAGSNTETGSSSSVASAGTGEPNAGSTSTYTGKAVQTRWGPVQVQIAVANGRVVSAQAVQYPSSNPHDQQINSYAIPQLNDAAVQAQSANLDSISGATVTSQGYIASLQSAIDQAHL